MTGSKRRPWCRGPAVALMTGLAVVATATATATVLPAPALAVETSQSSNHLDQPMADVAILAPDGPDGPPRLLVVNAIEPSPTGATIRVLERARAWEPIAESRIDLGIAGLAAPWLIGLGTDRYALIATSRVAELSIVVDLQVVAEPGGRAVRETSRAVLERAIADAAAADVDGDGQSELVLGTEPEPNAGCPESEILVYDAETLVETSRFELIDRLVGSAVVGSFDDVPGDDLLAYAEEVCVDASATFDNAHLIAVRLLDGQTLLDVPSGPRYEGSAVGPPLRVDLDGVAPDEAVAMTVDGLSILDPASDWAWTPIGTGRAVPLVVGPDSVGAGALAMLVWSEPLDGRIMAERFRRGPDGAVQPLGGAVFEASEDPDRWGLTRRATLDAAGRHEPAPGWLGGAIDERCPDVIVPGAILPCGGQALRSGPAWIGTRTIGAIGIGTRRSLLVAAGLAWDPTGGLPPSPTPWAVPVAGWWRHGPSVPFALSEMRASDTTYFRVFPVPLASVESTAAPELTITLPGFTGTRLFVRARALAAGAELPTGARSSLSVLGTVPDATSIATVVRVPVPPGVESGRDGSSATVDLSRATLPDGGATKRWALDLVPLNDWGELGKVASGIVIRDETGPGLNLAVPFTSAVWPAAARLAGSSEPGAAVVVDGVGAIELDRRGRFAFETTLAPWPQTYRLTATDPSGNTTVKEVSVVGGIDYRQFPWLLIAAVALLGLVTARGMVGEGRPGRPVRSLTGRGAVGFDDGPRPEIEELPPGGGLAPQ